MPDCWYCGKYVDSAPGEDPTHQICRDERTRREREDMCIYCGAELTQNEKDAGYNYHDGCMAGTRYGYP